MSETKTSLQERFEHALGSRYEDLGDLMQAERWHDVAMLLIAKVDALYQPSIAREAAHAQAITALQADLAACRDQRFVNGSDLLQTANLVQRCGDAEAKLAAQDAQIAALQATLNAEKAQHEGDKNFADRLFRKQLAEKEAAEAQLRTVQAELAAEREVLDDKRRLTRRLDVAMHGEEGAAQQASLCDLIGPAEDLRERAEQAERQLRTVGQALRALREDFRFSTDDSMRLNLDAILRTLEG